MADPTWPSPNDELEEIMYQVEGYRARQFGGTVIPCSSEASGPGRHNAAEWLRAAFHDMATTTNLGGVRRGGLDASLQYELTSSDNLGPAFNTTLKFMAEYYTSRSSMADLLALGVYYAVRSCGGPVVPITGGRVDAVAAGPIGVPLPQNTAFTFEQQFTRMGFSRTEMIQVTACGHSIGGVHENEFPEIVPVGSTANGEAPLDSTVAIFDNKVVTEYIAGNTTNPLVVGPSVRATRNADFKVFNYDANVTVRAMADATEFNNVCAVVLKKMIDTVPAGVILSDPIEPYFVKPVNMQLTLNSGAATMQLTGLIRVRTTNLGGDSVSGLTLEYKDRSGGNNCGSTNCKYSASLLGATQGFDDQFVWFPIDAVISTSTGISSFAVTLHMASGADQTFDNNGNSYPIQDAILIQKPQSCLFSGTSTVTAAVRNDRKSLPVSMFISYKTPTGNPNLPVPRLNNDTVLMTEGTCVGSYTFYTATYAGLGELAYASRIGVTSGSGSSALSDDFNAASELAGTCRSFQDPPSSLCTTGQASTPPGSSTTSSVGVTSSSTLSVDTTSSATISSTSTSPTGPTETLYHRETLGGYTLLGCRTESTVQGVRALGGAAFAYDSMTLEACMNNCTGYIYWGTEYGRECYCGDSLHQTSEDAPLADCNMVCGGDATQYCGAGDRLELYSTTASQPAPTATLAPKPTIPPYVRVGCYTEIPGGRALTGSSYADDAMTLEKCAAHCAGFTYWAAEYGRECYCGDTLDPLSEPAPEADCQTMVCAGDRYEYCGAGHRLELYRLATATSIPRV